MKQFCLELFEQMLKNIEDCSETHAMSAGYIECCFAKSERVAARLELEVERYIFSSEEEEIWFFKVMRPQFYAVIEFFSLMYKGELFAKHERDLVAYWVGEREYVFRFFKKHEEFYQYYKTDMTNLDKEYFLRKNSKDEFLTSFIAREKYLKYVSEKLTALQNYESNTLCKD